MVHNIHEIQYLFCHLIRLLRLKLIHILCYRPIFVAPVISSTAPTLGNADLDMFRNISKDCTYAVFKISELL
jgi:hypothetical protein